MDEEQDRPVPRLREPRARRAGPPRRHGVRLRPIADALAERGRVVVRRAYADWSYFDEDRRMLTRSHVELIEMPQRMGASRKNAADIKMAVDAMELAFERDYISTFVICTGDSDFTPLVHKLRELNKRVIGVGREGVDLGAAAAGLRRVPLLRPLEGVEVPAVRAPATAPVARRCPARGGAGPTSRRRTGRGAAAATSTASPCWSRRPWPGWAALQRRGDRLDAEAHAAAQGPDVQRVRLRVPGLRRAAAPPRRAQRGRADRRAGQGRPGASPCPEHGDREEAFASAAAVADLAPTAARVGCRV